MSELVENGIINNATLGFETHGILTSWITMEFDGTGQGYGGWSFGKDSESLGLWVKNLLNTFELSDWSKLKGTHVRVKRTVAFGGIQVIGHIYKDRWFDFKKIVENVKP